MPDRLPSLLILIGFWIPPAVAGWVAAGSVRYRSGSTKIPAILTVFVLGYAVLWFLSNLFRMPPYIPGAAPDPTPPTLRTAGWLAAVTALLVLPGSALACAVGFRCGETD
jgi:hypothetical protein